jgi:hypothetical protein
MLFLSSRTYKYILRKAQGMKHITQTFKENLVGNLNTNIYSTHASVLPLV